MNVEKTAVSADDMALINKFSRAELSESDVYSFKMVCCDTNIDRDGEAFTKNALQKLAELFIGKTVITNHIQKPKIRLQEFIKLSLKITAVFQGLSHGLISPKIQAMTILSSSLMRVLSKRYLSGVPSGNAPVPCAVKN